MNTATRAAVVLETNDGGATLTTRSAPLRGLANAIAGDVAGGIGGIASTRDWSLVHRGSKAPSFATSRSRNGTRCYIRW